MVNVFKCCNWMNKLIFPPECCIVWLFIWTERVPRKSERLFCSHVTTPVCFMNSSSCIQHLRNQKERRLKCHRESFFSRTGLFLNKRLLFFLLLCFPLQSGQVAMSHLLQHHSALSVHAAAQSKAIFALKCGRSLEAAAEDNIQEVLCWKACDKTLWKWTLLRRHEWMQQ